MPAGRFARALLLWGCALALSACTAGSPRATGTESDAQSDAQSGGNPSLEVPLEVPGMTMVPEAKTCVRLTPSATPPLTVQDLWPKSTAGGFGSSEITRGPDAASCTAALPTQPSCQAAYPWAAMSTSDVLIATGADREVDGLIDTTLPQGASGGGRQPATLLYLVLRFDPARAGASEAATTWLSDAMVACAGAREGTIGGIRGLVGSQPSERGASTPATSALVTGPDSITWLLFDGDGWTPGERDRVASLAVARLTS